MIRAGKSITWIFRGAVMKNVLITPGKSSFPLALMPRSRTAFFMGVPNREMITAKNTKFLGLEILWEGTVPA